MINDLVSNSEADTFLSCERKHYYAFGEKLAAKTTGPGLTRGNAGHAILEAYYGALIENEDRITSVTTALTTASTRFDQLMLEAVQQGPEQVEVMINLRKLLREYFEYYAAETDMWQILAVEKEFLTDDFPFKPDLIKRNRRTGEVVIVDHKFLYNFYSPVYMTMFPQLTKYVGFLRAQGFRVDHAEYNMIRHRDNAQERFSRVKVVMPETRIARWMHEQVKITDRINSFKSLSREDWELAILRTANSFTCPNCPFARLCQSDLDGLHGRQHIVTMDFQENTYGYHREGVAIEQ